MRKKLNFLMLAMFAIVASIAFSSCTKDEPVQLDNYTMQLQSVISNLQDANGQSLDNALKEELISNSDFDSTGSFTIGKKITEESAINAFNISVERIKTLLYNSYVASGALPKGGVIAYTFVLKLDSGTIVKSSTIKVTDSNVII